MRVNCIALGPTMTENFRSFVLPKDDPDGAKVNGTTIECDGGMLPGVLYDAGLKTITDLL